MSPPQPVIQPPPAIQLSAKFTFDGRSVSECTSDACANRRVDGVESCCSMLSPAWHLVCPQWMFSMSSFLHRLYALPSSRTTFAQQFQRVSFTFFFHALRNKKKTRLACWRREHFGGRKIEMEILKILRRFERLWSYLNIDLLGLKLG